MASSPPSSVKSEPIGALSSGHDPNLSYTSIYDTSIETTLPISTEPLPSTTTTTTTSIFIDPPASPSGEGPFDLMQGFSAPTLPIYINMGVNETADDVTFAGTNGVTSKSVTADIPMSRSLATMDVDHPIPSAPSQRQSHYHHPHHFPHHSQNRNRYPYLQRPSTNRGLHRSQGAPTSMENSFAYLEQRPAFRRSYFALRRQRIPKGKKLIEQTNDFLLIYLSFFIFTAPPMPKHLYPGYKQIRASASPTGRRTEAQQSTDDSEEEDEGKTIYGIRSLRKRRRSIDSDEYR